MTIDNMTAPDDPRAALLSRLDEAEDFISSDASEFACDAEEARAMDAEADKHRETIRLAKAALSGSYAAPQKCFDCGCPQHEKYCPECGHRNLL